MAIQVHSDRASRAEILDCDLQAINAVEDLEGLLEWSGAFLENRLPGWRGRILLGPENSGLWRAFELPQGGEEQWEADHPLLGELAQIGTDELQALEGELARALPEGEPSWLIALRNAAGELQGGLLLASGDEGAEIEEQAGPIRIHAAFLTLLVERLRQRRRMGSLEGELAELESLKASFLSTVSHELNTPLTSILGFTSLARSSSKNVAPAEMVRWLDAIHDSAQQLKQLVSEMLVMAGMARAEFSLELQDLDFPELLRQFSEERLVQLPGPDRVRFTSPPLSIKVRVDCEQFHRVLENLVKNALKFSSPDSPVDLSWRLIRGRRRTDANDYLRLSVADRGAGIPEAEQERIFERFYQIDGSNTREYGGTGLGLSVAKEFAEAMGGKLWVKSEAGEGSIFSFTVPVPRPGGRPQRSDSA